MMNASKIERILTQNLERIRERIAGAAARARRDTSEIRLIAVTKYAPDAALVALQNLGLRDFGESRIQQLTARAALFGKTCATLNAQEQTSSEGTAVARSPTWHMVGHVQRNKVKPLLDAARIIHSLDSIRLAEALQTQAEQLDAAVDCLIEVNVAAESSKTGLASADVAALLEAVQQRPNLRACGLMTMAPFDENPERVRPVFAAHRALADDMTQSGLLAGNVLSMGMSHDFEIAIEEGATMIRIGSALFEGLEDIE